MHIFWTVDPNLCRFVHPVVHHRRTTGRDNDPPKINRAYRLLFCFVVNTPVAPSDSSWKSHWDRSYAALDNYRIMIIADGIDSCRYLANFFFFKPAKNKTIPEHPARKPKPFFVVWKKPSKKLTLLAENEIKIENSPQNKVLWKSSTPPAPAEVEIPPSL